MFLGCFVGISTLIDKVAKLMLFGESQENQVKEMCHKYFYLKSVRLMAL